MASFEGRVSYSSLPKIDKRQTQFHYDDEFIGSEWTEPEDGAKVSYPPVASKPLKQDYAFQFPLESEDFIDGSGYDSSEEPCDSAQTNMNPEVNLKNVLSGMVAILTGRNKALGPPSDKQLPNSNVSFLGSEKNGETYLHSSVYTPSAPPLLETTAFDYNAYKDVLEAEPPEWLPDSSTTVCMQCTFPFTALTRGRHHCRFCGGVFCRTCSKGRCLLPVKFRERNPQRVCDACYDRLDPLQGILINNISNASQAAKHDVMDWTCTRGWLNLPVGFSMEHEIYKASNTLRSYSQVARLNPERSIPLAVLRGAKGLAILTVAKAGVLLSYKLGTGLVIARRSDGSWSAPSSIFSVGLGWGAQVGGELMDFIIVLHDLKAVKTFCSRMHFSLGAGCSVAAGPIGRVLEADMRAGDRGSGMCYTYSCSKGAFVGVSLEGNIVATRMDTNLQFYGDPYLTTSDILLGTVDRPKAAEPLYTAVCWGVAYRIANKEDQEVAITYLEVREKQYDKKAYLDFFTEPNATTPAVSDVMVYIASPDKKHNVNYLGPASIEEIAKQIVQAEGPSGPNRDYLFQLEQALLQIGCKDAHVMDLASEVRRILSERELTST